jgi:hypothetical protein
MKIKKLYTYKSEQNVWRILLTNADQFVIETRDVNTKEVFFNCIDIKSGKTVFKDYQLEEKYWAGIETIYKDVIFFHKYAKPDMPGHKEIFCFDIASQKILWQQDALTFLFVYSDLVICSVNTFEGWHFYALDYKTGEIVTDYGENAAQINTLKNLAEGEKDFSQYKFPEKITKEIIKKIEEETIIKESLRNLDIIGDVEYTYYDDLFLMNYHYRAGGILQNKFTAVDLEKNKIIFNEILNSEAKAFVPDTFFVYKDILILLKERDQIIICRIE